MTDAEIKNAIDGGNFSAIEKLFNGRMVEDVVYSFKSRVYFPKSSYPVWQAGGYVVLKQGNKLIAGIVYSELEDYRG